MKLFSSPDELANFVDVAKDFNLQAIAPNEDDVLRDYFKPYLGPSMLTAIYAAYTNQDDPIKENIVLLVQKPLARLMFWMWTPEGALSISDNGIGVLKTNTIMPASDSKLDKLDRKYLNAGLNGIDELLEYMEANKDNAFITPWTSSAYYTLYKGAILQNIDQFRKYALISGRRMFIALRSYMDRVEQFEVSSLLGGFFTNFKSYVLNPSPTNASYNTLIDLSRGLIAHRSLESSILRLSIIEDEKGYNVVNTKSDSSSQEYQFLPKDRALLLKEEFKSIADMYASKILDLLESSPDNTFPGYTKRASDSTKQYVNTTESPNFYMT